MISFTQTRSVHTQVSLTSAEARDVTLQFLRAEVLKGGYVTEDGRLEDWSKEPHGSGTTTDHGPATPLQLAAAQLIKLLNAPATEGSGGTIMR